MRLLLLTAFFGGVAAIAACDRDLTPTIAGLSGPSSASATPQLVVNPSSIQLLLNSSIQLTTNAPAGQQAQLQWSSLSSTVATVSPSGLVNAVGVGSATITARYSFDTTNTASSTVTVFAAGTP